LRLYSCLALTFSLAVDVLNREVARIVFLNATLVVFRQILLVHLREVVVKRTVAGQISFPFDSGIQPLRVEVFASALLYGFLVLTAIEVASCKRLSVIVAGRAWFCGVGSLV